jgi:hypothetical protein
MGSGNTLHLPLGDHMHAFDAAQKDTGTAKILESQHGSRASFDCPMVLLDEVVEIIGLTNPDGRFTIGIDGFERSEIGAALVDGSNWPARARRHARRTCKYYGCARSRCGV